jgi:hypothetical protein
VANEFDAGAELISVASFTGTVARAGEGRFERHASQHASIAPRQTTAISETFPNGLSISAILL